MRCGDVKWNGMEWNETVTRLTVDHEPVASRCPRQRQTSAAGWSLTARQSEKVSRTKGYNLRSNNSARRTRRSSE